MTVLHSKQATSLRVDQGLYDRLAALAKKRGSSITHQLEDALRGHLATAVVDDHKPLLESTVARVVNESLEATVNAKIEELKQRLSGLLAKNAVDTAVLYLMQIRRMGEEEVSTWRKAAASHVRGRLVDLQSEALANEELDALRRKAEEFVRREKAAADALALHRGEAERLRTEMEGLHPGDRLEDEPDSIVGDRVGEAEPAGAPQTFHGVHQGVRAADAQAEGRLSMALYVRVMLCRDLGQAKAHVNYIAFRSRETVGEQRGAFSARSDHAAVQDFADQLGDRLTRHPMANKAYKMHISLSEREFRQLGLTSWKPIVRVPWRTYSTIGGKFYWIAAEHMAKGHPHVHLVIKAVYRDESGRHRQLRLDRQHLEQLKREIGRVIERHRAREQERARPLHMADTLLRAFDRALREILAEDREEEHEIEQAQRRRLRRRPPRDADDRGR